MADRRPFHRFRTDARRGSVTFAIAVVIALCFAGLGCDSGSEPAEGAATSAAPATSTAGGETTASEAFPPANPTTRDFDPAFFDPERSFIVDNEWLSLEPGTKWVHRGWTEEGGKRISHTIVSVATDLVKEIDGVRALVGWDRDFSDGELVEAELVAFAQDRGGNVWHLGEYSEVYEEGEFVGGSAWFVGSLNRARAGIQMLADPELGSPAYSEGFAPAPYFWQDWGKVDKVGESTCVPVDCFDDVLVIDEFEPRKPGAHQLKYYARGVGNIRTGWRGSDADHEVLVLAKLEHLSPEKLAAARRAALALEDRALVYGRTGPAETRPAEG